MKRIALIVPFLFLFSCSVKERKIKIITESQYSIEDNFGKYEKGNLEHKKTTKYNLAGNILDVEIYLSNGSLYSQGSYLYNDIGNLKEVKWMDSEGNIKDIETLNYKFIDNIKQIVKTDEEGKIISLSKYDTIGNLIEEKTYRGDFTETIYNIYNDKGFKLESKSYYSRIVFIYDVNGKIEKHRFFDKYGNFEGENVYWYDDRGNNIELTCKDAEGSISILQINKFDNYGNKIENNYTGLSGKIKNTTYYKYDNLGNKSSKKSEMGNYSFKYKYNSAGKKVEETEYYADGKIRNRIKTKYNEKGEKIEETEYDENGKTKINTKFDSLERIAEIREDNPPYSEITKTMMKYDVQGRLNESLYYDKNGILKSFELTTYDELDRKIAVNELESKSFFKYDTKGNIIEENLFNVAGNLIYKIIYTHNELGQLISKEWIDDDAISNEKYTYEYNNSGQIIVENHFSSLLNSTYKTLYLSFDNAANWLKSELYKNDKLIEIDEREFEYY